MANSINKRYEIYKKIYNLSNENIKADQKLYNYLQQKTFILQIMINKLRNLTRIINN